MSSFVIEGFLTVCSGGSTATMAAVAPAPVIEPVLAPPTRFGKLIRKESVHGRRGLRPIDGKSTMNHAVRRFGTKASRSSVRTRVLMAADGLFYRRGIRSVGVDEIAREAGVAKVSLYRAFPSKDDLIVAYLNGRDEAFWHGWDAAVAGEGDALAAVQAAIGYLCRAIEIPGYRGCPFANFASEFPDSGHGGRAVVLRSKRAMRDRLDDLCARLHAPQGEGLADALVLLAEGAFSMSQTASDGARTASRNLARSSELVLRVWLASEVLT